MLKNSPHALQPGSRANLEGFVSAILRQNLRTKPRDQTLRAQTQLHTLSLKAVAQHAPSQKDGPVAVQPPCLHGVPQAMPATARETGVPPPLGGQSREGCGQRCRRRAPEQPLLGMQKAEKADAKNPEEGRIHREGNGKENKKGCSGFKEISGKTYARYL